MLPKWWVFSVGSLLLIAGCATTTQNADGEEQLTVEDCVTDETQRLLTFCASKDAATLAERQYTLERAAQSDDETPADMVRLPVEGAPVRGERDAPITIHLFSDLRCQDCRVAYQRLSAEVEHRPGQMRLVFRHLPIDEEGRDLARAAIAAGEQGKFWEFVDELYSYERLPSQQRWAEIAGDAGLDVETWQRDQRMPTADALLEHDAIQADKVDVVEAPTYFVNGIRKVGGVALQEFDEVADGELEHVEAMQDAGLEGADISWRRILQNYQPVDWDEVQQAEEELQQRLPVVHVPADNSPQRGSREADSLVTAVVFGDFSCEFSAEAAQMWSELVELFGDRGLRVVFKHFPLSMNGGAERAAAASVIAQQGGVFWEFHDALFFDDVELDIASLEQQLRRLGWDGSDFPELVDSEYIRSEVAADRRTGEESAVEGTPTVFINGIMLEGVWPTAELAPLIEQQIELAESVRDLTGNEGEALYRDLVEANRR